VLIWTAVFLGGHKGIHCVSLCIGEFEGAWYMGGPAGWFQVTVETKLVICMEWAGASIQKLKLDDEL